MADDLDAHFDSVPGDDEQSSAPAPEPEAQPESEPAPEASAQTYADLEAVLPDAADIPEGYRGKKLADVIRVSEQHKYEAGVAAQRNQQWNAMESRARMAEAAVEFMKNQSAQNRQPMPQQQPRETSEEYLQRLATQPGETIDERVDQRLQPVVQQLRTTQEELLRTRGEQAQTDAREYLGIDRQTWTDIIRPGAAVIMQLYNWPPNDPRAWAEAAKIHVNHSLATAQRFAAPAPAAQPAPVEVPRPGAPPNGGARSQARPSAAPKLRERDKENLESFADVFGFKPGSKEYKEMEAFAASYKGAAE